METALERVEGQICPICKQPFQKDCDVAVCPDCGLPHHRECFLKAGLCAHHAFHGLEDCLPEGEQFNAPTTCPVCGSSNPSHVSNCLRCGVNLAVQSNSQPEPFFNIFSTSAVFNPQLGGLDPQQTIDGALVEDIANCVAVNTQYYLPKFNAMDKSGSRISFNWAAFLIPYFWFFYRKIYSFGVLAMTLIISFLIIFSPISQRVYEIYQDNTMAEVEEFLRIQFMVKSPLLSVCLVIFVLAHLIFGLIANKVYLDEIIKKVRKIRQSELDPNEHRMTLMASGGVNYFLPALVLFIINTISNFLIDLFYS